ncbi:condensation domain-containing protein [Nocardiopsis sp. JB363]|uniref:condensation domain-containing protein n=1 Tax=Nocardiopsis sp. JB363 TaxID=1434837 RepID=UPI00097AB17A|nr:condensation domain-containing protein [Nocardiopsis sp. JB363]SIO90367.1 Siderophore biosynthesis non-ribosomal peptide synthetase modules [Nocardiopsis sp. JB363]
MFPPGEVLPLTPEQNAVLFDCLNEGAGAFALQHRLRVTPFEPDVFQRAWDAVVARHDALRTAFRWRGRSRAVQVVQDEPPTKVRTTYLTRMDAGRTEEWALRLFDEEFAREPDLEGPRLVVPSAVYSDHAAYLSLTTHHLVMDGLSSRLLFSDLVAHYDAFLGGAEPATDRVGTFADYVRWRNRRPAVSRPSIGGGDPGEQLLEAIGARPSHRSRTRLVHAFPNGLLERMSRFSQRQGITPAAQFHAAWALMLQETVGSESAYFGSTSYGRPPDLPLASKTVGMFNMTNGMRVDAPMSKGTTEWLLDVQTRMSATWQSDEGTGLGSAPVLSIAHFAPVATFRGPHRNAEVEILDGADRSAHPLVCTVFLADPAVAVIHLNGIETDDGVPDRLIGSVFDHLASLTADNTTPIVSRSSAVQQP